jgi:hypothetical protein
MTALIMVSASSFGSWFQLFFVGVILLPILIMNKEQLKRSKLALVALLLLPFLLFLPATAQAFDLFVSCDWDSLVATYGEYGAWAAWIWGGC